MTDKVSSSVQRDEMCRAGSSLAFEIPSWKKGEVTMVQETDVVKICEIQSRARGPPCYPLSRNSGDAEVRHCATGPQPSPGPVGH